MPATDKPTDNTKAKDTPVPPTLTADKITGNSKASDKHESSSTPESQDNLQSVRLEKLPTINAAITATAKDTAANSFDGKNYFDFSNFADVFEQASPSVSAKIDATPAAKEVSTSSGSFLSNIEDMGSHWLDMGTHALFQNAFASSDKQSVPSADTKVTALSAQLDNSSTALSSDATRTSVSLESNRDFETSDRTGALITRDGQELKVVSKDGSVKYEKDGNEQTLKTKSGEYKYNSATREADYNDGHGSEVSANKSRVAFNIGNHHAQELKSPPADINELPQGITMWRDGKNQPVTAVVRGEGDDKVIAEVMHGPNGKTMRRLIGSDYVIDSTRENHQEKLVVYDKQGNALFKDKNGQPLVMTQDEVTQHLKEMPPGFQRGYEAFKDHIAMHGVHTTEKGISTDTDAIERDEKTGNIVDHVKAANGQPAQTYSINSDGTAHMGVDGHTGVDIKGDAVTFHGYDGQSAGNYNMKSGAFDTPEATFGPDGTNLKYANTYVNSDGSYSSTGSLEPGSPAYTQLVSAGASAGNKAVDMASFVASRIGSEAITSGMVDSLGASAGSLSELRAICIAHGVTDALGPIDQGLSYIASILPQAQAMAALGQGLSARGQSGSEILSAQKEMGSKTAGALLQEASFQQSA